MSDIYGHIIVIKRNGQDGAAYPLASDVCLFGKGQDCDVRVQLPSVSEEHCVLRVGTKRRVYLTSMSRLNMTLLNNVPVNGTVPVNHMDTLTVVDRSFRFQYPVDSVYAEDFFNSVPKVMALKIISPKQKPPLPLASYEKEGTRDSDGDTSAELSLSRGKASPSLRRSDTSKIDAFLSSNPKKTYGKKSSSPGYRLSVSTRKKRVSFGPTLSPEKFNKSMPPATPVRKGSLPFRRQSSVPDYFGSPVITQYSGSRKSRISFVLKNDSIGEEVSLVHGKRSPQTPQNIEMTVKESVTKFSPKRRSKQKQKLNSPSGKFDSENDATSINITSVACHQKMHSPRRRISVRQSLVKLDHAENSFSLPANAGLYDRWSQDSNYPGNISPKTNGKSVNNLYMSTLSPGNKIKAGTSSHERKSGIGNCKTVDGFARTTDCSPVDKKINNSKKKGPGAKVLKRLSRGKDIPRRASLATVKVSDSFKKDYSYSRKLRKSLPVLGSFHVTDQKSTRSKEIHNESPLIKAKIDAVLSRRSSRGSIKKPIKSAAAALEVDNQTQEIIGTKRKIEYSPVKQSAKKGQFLLFTNNTATPALLRQEKCMVVKSSSIKKTSKTPIKTPKKNDSSVKSKKKGAFAKKSVQKLLWTEVVQKGIMKKNVGRKPKVVRSLLSRAIKRRNPTQLKNCNRKAVPLSERVLSGTSTGHANSPQTIVINKKIQSSRFPPKSVTHKTPSKTPASSVKSVTPRSTSSTNRVKKLNKSYSSILLDVSSIQTPNISQEMFVSPLTSPRNQAKRSFITKFINENQQLSSRDEPSSPKQIKSNSRRANHKSENLTGLKKLLAFSPNPDYTNVKGIKNIFRTPNRSPKADYTDVKGIKNLLRTPSRSPKADFTDVKGIKELMLTPRRTPIANYSDVKGVKGLLQTPKGTPKADYTDVSGVKKLFKTASPKEKYSANQLKNAVSLKGLCSKASPKAGYSNAEGLKNLFKMANKHKANEKMGSCNKEPDYGNVEGVKQLFQSMQDISEFNISGLQELFLTPTVSSPSSVRSSLRSHERKDNTIISAKTPKLRAATPRSLRKQYNSYSKNISCSSFPNSCNIQSGKSNLYLDTTPTINYEKDILISGVIMDSVGSLDFSGHRQSRTPNPKVITQLPHMGQISENDTSFPPYSELHDIHSDKSNVDLSVTDSSYKNDTLSQESFIILDSISSRQTSTLRRLKDSFSTHCTVHAFHVNTRRSLANSLSPTRSSGMAIPSASKGLRSHDSFISSEGLDLTAQQVLSKSALDGLDSKNVSPLYSDEHLNKIPEVKKDKDINSSNFAEKIGTNYIEHFVSLSDLPKRSLRPGRKGQNVSEIKMEFCKSAASDTEPCPIVEIPKRRGRKPTAVNIDKPMRNSKVKVSGKRGRKNMSDIRINDQGMHLQGNEVKPPKNGKLSKAHQNSDEWVSKTRGCKKSKIIKEQPSMTNKQSNYKKPTKKPRETSNSESLPTQNGHSVPVIISTKTSNKTRGRGKRKPIIPEIFIIGNSSVHNDNSVVGVQYETNGHNIKSSSQDDSGTVDFQKNTGLLVTGDISAKADQFPVTKRGSSHCHSKKDRSISSRVLRARKNLSSLNESDTPDVETMKVIKSPKDLSKNTEGKVEPKGKPPMDGKVEKRDRTPKRKQTSRQFLEYKDAEKCPSIEGTNYVKRSIKANAQSKVAASGRKRKASDEDPQHSSPQKKTRGSFKVQTKGGSTESKQSDEKKNSKLKKEMVELPSNLPRTLSPILEQKEDDIKTPVSKKRGRRTKASLKQTIEEPFSQRMTRSRRKM